MNSNQSFNFKCHPDISCFNECCQNLQQVLAPYDIIRLKHHFNCDSSTFLNTYTICTIGPETGLPIVELKTKSQNDLHCIFVSKKGCLVYPNRPSTCRYYPLGRFVSKSRETGKVKANHFMIRESHCFGHDTLFQQSIDQWRIDQELQEFDTYNDLMIHLIAAKNNAGLQHLSENQRYLIYMGCYDIDAFRQYAKQNNILMDQSFPLSIDGDVQWFTYIMRWLEETVIQNEF
jgi:hypothetical protein